MEREKLEHMLIDYIDNQLNAVDRQMIERELTNNAEVYQLYQELKQVMQGMDNLSLVEPSAKLRINVEEIIRNESKIHKAKTIFFQPTFYRVAAAVALLVVGGGLGFWISEQQKHNAEMSAMRKEMEATKLMMMSMIEDQRSASQRLQGVSVAFKMEKADDEIVNALVKTLNEDRNTNVRMAALEALAKFHQQPHVRKALIESLNTQKDPIIQIALIRLMVEIKEKSVMQQLQRITNDEEVLPVVKDEAHVGILKLS